MWPKEGGVQEGFLLSDRCGGFCVGCFLVSLLMGKMSQALNTSTIILYRDKFGIFKMVIEAYVTQWSASSILYIICVHASVQRAAAVLVKIPCFSPRLWWHVTAIFCLRPHINKCQQWWPGLGCDLMHCWISKLTPDPDTSRQLTLRQNTARPLGRQVDFDGHAISVADKCH